MRNGKQVIVIIDDSDVCLQIARDALETANFHVVTTTQGVGFNSLVKQNDADLVLIDLQMPGLSGDRLAKITAGAQRCPVLLHSDRSDAELRVKVKESGAAGYVRKQPHGAGLVDGVKAALAKANVPRAVAGDGKL